jgi:hypothetical protein
MISADKSIRKECKFCQPGKDMTPEKCCSSVCQLNPGVWEGGRSRVKQIRAFCLGCAGTPQAVEECGGRPLRENGNGSVCWLYPYRFGKNPARKSIIQTAGHKKGLQTMLKRKRDVPGEAV